MDTEFFLTGTLEELSKILQDEFKMSEQQASFFLGIMLIGEEDPSSEEPFSLSLWYTKPDQADAFQTNIFNTRFSISFTEIKKNLAENLYGFFFELIQSFITQNDIGTAGIIFTLLQAIYSSGTYINDDECCVYYQALKWKAMHQGATYFSIEDIYPDQNEGICINLVRLRDNKWKCECCHDDKCVNREKYFKTVLDNLVDRHVFAHYNDEYRFEV